MSLTCLAVIITVGCHGYKYFAPTERIAHVIRCSSSFVQYTHEIASHFKIHFGFRSPEACAGSGSLPGSERAVHSTHHLFCLIEAFQFGVEVGVFMISPVLDDTGFDWIHQDVPDHITEFTFSDHVVVSFVQPESPV